jgi:RNA polymerase sigma factor (sigma-70 family)
MSLVEQFLGETLASGELDRQLGVQYARWRKLWDFQEFRAAVLGRAWERRQQFKGQTAPEFLAWLRRLAWSAAVEQWRQRRRQAGLLHRFAALLPRWARGASEELDTRDLVEWLLAGLTARERKLLVLKYYRQMTADQLADALATTRAGVHQLHYRALAKLRERLKNRGQ